LKDRFGNLISKIRGKSVLQLPAYFKKLLTTVSSTKLYSTFIQTVIFLSIVLGALISAVGFCGLVAKGVITSSINLNPVNIDPFSTSLIISLAGILLTFEGVALLRAFIETSQLIVLSIFLGYFALVISGILLGLGYRLFAGIAGAVLGYLWLITVLAWLQRGD
jgi:hypothetical protein